VHSDRSALRREPPLIDPEDTPSESLDEGANGRDGDSLDASLAEAGADGEALEERLARLEKHNRRMKYALALMLALVGFLFVDQVIPETVLVKQKLMESEQVKLLDNAGNTRLFLRMYSRVPVLQMLDSKGKPRLSLGMRFDDTPFIDLSDASGRTRATFEMNEKDEPTLRLFDESGETSFKLN